MKFFQGLAMAAAVGVAQAQISAKQTVTNINDITSMSKALDTTAKTVTLLNGFQTGPVSCFARIYRFNYCQKTTH